MAQMDVGKVAAIEVKIRIDMPLPTPRSVIISPSHMIRPVPAVIVATISVIVTSESFGMTGTGQPWKRLPDRATATYVVDCNTARAIVRYRVYWVSLEVPAWPSFFSASNFGITTVSSWVMMLAVMYGMIP